MALQKQTIPIILGNGIDTKTDEKVVRADKLLQLENGVFTKKQSLSTRFGSTKFSKNILGTDSDIENPKKLITFQDELLLATSEKLYSYISSIDQWADRGSISAVSITSKSIVRNTTSQANPDSNSLKGVSVYAWEEGSEVKASVFDDASGLPLLAEVVIATGTKPKVFANQTYLFVYYISGNNWNVRKINPTNPSAFDAAVIVTNDIEDNFDLHPHGNNLVYIYNTTGANCNVGYIKTDGTIGGPIDGFPTDVNTTNPGDSCVAIISRFEGDFSDRIYALYANTTNGLTCTVYDLGLGVIANTVIDNTTTPIRNVTAIMIDSSNLKIYYEISAAQGYDRFIKSNTITLAGVAGAAIVSVRSLGIVGKAFVGSDENIYLVAGYRSNNQPTTLLMRETFSNELLQAASIIQKGTANGQTDKTSSLANVVNFKFANTLRTQLQSDSGTVFSLVGIQSTTVSFVNEKLYLYKELGKNVHIAGGVLYDYDGKSAVEHGYHFFPEAVANTPSGGGSIEAGTRLYYFVYEWTDNQGQVHRSSPSIPLSVTNTAGQQNTFTISTLRVTKKCTASDRSNIRIVGYRTLAGQQTAYRFTSQTGSNFNTTTADTITIVDTLADAGISGNDVIYTTGGVLENFSPGSCVLVEAYRERLFVGGLEDDDLIGYSKQHILNESVDFTEEFTFRADDGQGGVTALAKLDEKVLIFKSSEIYYQLGQGPTSTGAQNDYQQPIFITTDVGTNDPQSVVSMPLGIMFKSAKGYYLISRSLEPIYVGEEVEAFNGLTCTGAVLMDQYNEVRFTHSDGVTLVYDYIERQWATFTDKEAISSANWQGQWVIMKENGDVFHENPNTFFDGQSPVTKKIRTAWIQAANLQGAQRIYRVLFIGKLKSKHRLKISVRYDFDESIRDVYYYDTEEILGNKFYGDGYYGEDYFYGGGDGVYQVEIRPSIQKCQAISFTLEDLNDEDVDGAGFEITGMTMTVGIKGMFRPAMTKRVGPS